MAKKKETGTALVKWEEEFANMAKETAKGVVVSEGKFLSFRNGDLSFAGESIPDNELEVVVIGWVLHNTYYDPKVKFDPKNPEPPICYSFGRDTDEMEPHEDASDKQCDACATCPLNEFGSGVGNAKACKNGVRLALISSADLDNIPQAEVVYAAIPPTSIKNWNNYVGKTLLKKHKRPHWSVVTKLSVSKESESVFQVHFEIAEDGILTDAKLFPQLQTKYEEAMEGIEFPYQERERQPAKKTAKATKPVGKKFSKR